MLLAENPVNEDDVVRIPLTDSLFAVVDRADARYINSSRWSATQRKRYISHYYGDTIVRVPYEFNSKRYAIRQERQDGKSRTVWMHREIMEFHGIRLSRSDVIDHINGNSLDNRFSNLRVVTVEENGWWKGQGSSYPCVDKWHITKSLIYYHVRKHQLDYWADDPLEAACAYCIRFAEVYGRDHIALEHFPDLRQGVDEWREKSRAIQHIQTRHADIHVIHKKDGSHYYAAFLARPISEYFIHAYANNELACAINLWQHIARSYKRYTLLLDRHGHIISMFDTYPELAFVLEQEPALKKAIDRMHQFNL